MSLGQNGNTAAMTLAAFSGALPYGDLVLSLCVALFAFTTMLGWSYYGERCAEFLLGPRVITPFRILWVIGIFVGTQMSLELVWKMTDALNGLMAIPNLIALILLSPIVFKLTKAYFDQEKSEQTTTGNSAQGQ